MVCGPEALKGHRRACVERASSVRRACDSRRVHLGSLFGSKKSWMIIIMLFGPLDSDRDCMAFGRILDVIIIIVSQLQRTEMTAVLDATLFCRDIMNIPW